MGSDADMVVIDLGGRTELRGADMHSGAAYTPYEGWTLDVAVEKTFLRGRLAFADGEVVAETGGRYLPRRTSGRAALASGLAGATR